MANLVRIRWKIVSVPIFPNFPVYPQLIEFLTKECYTCSDNNIYMRLNKNSFTLTELIIVIVIISVLASIAIPTIGLVKKKAIATEAIAAPGTIRTAEKLYYLEYGEHCGVPTLVEKGYLG